MAEDVASPGPRLIVRLDDFGFCHAANLAVRRILEEGICTALSTIVTTPWLEEAVDIARDFPEVSIGVHLTLNSEWRQYRWGPVASRNEVPTVVNGFGRFYGTRRELMAGGPNLGQVERELSCQIELAMKKGLPVSYCDNHMGTPIGTREFQEIMERLAHDYAIGISRYFGEEETADVYARPPSRKLRVALQALEGLAPGRLYLFVLHPGADVPELSALTDLNATGLPEMSKHRQAETDLLCAAALREAIGRNGIRLVGYRELRDEGLDRMRRPFDAPSYDDVVREAREPAVRK